MRIQRWLLTVAAVSVMLPIASEPAHAQADLFVWAFQGTTGQEHFPNTRQGRIRRGRTSTVRIVKHLIDLEPSVRISGGNATMSNVTSGHHTNGVGYKQMSINVPLGTAIGTNVTVTVGHSDTYTFRVVRNGIVTSQTPNPDPSTLAAGQPWSLTIQGSDLGSPVFHSNSPSCHSVTYGNRTDNSLTATITRNAGCTNNSGSATLQPITDETTSNYRLTSGNLATYPFSYLPIGDVCTSRPDISNVVVTSPQSGVTINYLPATPSPTNVQFTWSGNTQPGNVPAPKNEFIITRPGTTRSGFPTTISTPVTGTSATFAFAIPGTYTIGIRARNCDATPQAPTTTVTFTLRYQ